MKHLENLNQQQKKAVLHTDGPLLVIAGAGTGKTRTITHRIAHLVAQGVPPEKILAITFTNKAAGEMRERITTMLGSETLRSEPSWYSNQKIVGPFIGTFHSLGVHILRTHGTALGIPKHFSIYDKDDSLRAIKKALKEAGLPKEEYPPQVFRSRISRAKGEGVNFETYQQQIGVGTHILRAVSEVWERYNEILKEEHALDFDDLLLLPLHLLQKNEEIRTYYQQRWSHIHIDEYQDTNRVQYELSKLLTNEKNNICVVGDMDQSIYSWRGARPRNMKSFEDDFKDVTIIPLAENYRSTPQILEAANKTIEKNTLRKEEMLTTSQLDGDKIGVALCGDEGAEAHFVAQQVEKYISDGVSPSEIAILFRTNFQSRALEEVFLKNALPYQVVGTRFFERREVKDVLGYISASLNRESISNVTRIANVPRRGIGKVTLMHMIRNELDQLSGRARDTVYSFYRILDDIAEYAEEHSVSEIITFTAKTSGLEAMLKDEGDEGMERLFNVRELAVLGKRYDQLPPYEGLLKFLEDAALASDQDALATADDSVKLMTVHAAKGLEFDYVFIVGLEEGLFPIQREDMKKDDQEEERRLFYVALTRARKRAVLTSASIRTIFGNTKSTLPSQFIADIGEENMEVLGLDDTNGWSGRGLLTIR
jgi:DNA helicase-2/ATP-dependent DNA helicase PcrA